MKEFLLLVLGFGFLIFVHELGHFLVAKWVGIRCPQFAIGFGTAICSWRKGIGFRVGGTEKEFQRRTIEQLKKDGVEPLGLEPVEEKDKKDKDADEEMLDIDLSDLDLGLDDDEDEPKGRKFYTPEQIFATGDQMGLSETEYRLNYLPLGGYVKMLGQEDIDPNAKSSDPRAYNNKPIWARACVISAGVVMNMIFGALFLTAAFMIGVQFPSATVGGTVPGMPAATTFAQGHDGDLKYLGLRTGDEIVAVNGEEPEDFKDVVIATALGSSTDSVELTIKRRGAAAGEFETLTYILTPERQADGERLLSAGFESGPGLQVGYIQGHEGASVDWIKGRLDAVSVDTRGPEGGIRIHAANGNTVTTYGDFLYAFDASDGRPVSVTLTDPSNADETLTVDVASNPTLVRYPEGPANLLGLVPAGQVSAVVPDSPAEASGLKAGDVVVQLGTLEWPTSTAEVAAMLEDTKKDPLAMVVMRGGETIDLGEVTPKDGKVGLGIEFAFDSTVARMVVEGSPADAAFNAEERFMPGTRITAINGQRVMDWRDIQRVLASIAQAGTDPTEVRISYVVPVEGAPTDTATLAVTAEQVAELATAGWEPGFDGFFPLAKLVTLKADGIGEAFVIGLDKTKDFVLQTYITLLRLIQGEIKLYNLRGPVGIVHVGTTVAKQGLPYLLFFLGLISVNLAVINFLPIPIVDGGHMVFLAIEKITGSPPSPKVMTAALYMGLAVIGFVFITTLFYDVTRLIGF